MSIFRIEQDKQKSESDASLCNLSRQTMHIPIIVAIQKGTRTTLLANAHICVKPKNGTKRKLHINRR